MYKEFLSGLNNKTSDVFDLKILGDSVQFDYIVDPPITECGTLDTANAVYTLQNDVNSSGTCFTITADNVTLDCQGYTINYSAGGASDTYGVYANNIFIRNITL